MLFAQFTPEETSNVALQRRVQKCHRKIFQGPPALISFPETRGTPNNSNSISGLTSSSISTSNNENNSTINKTNSSMSTSNNGSKRFTNTTSTTIGCKSKVAAASEQSTNSKKKRKPTGTAAQLRTEIKMNKAKCLHCHNAYYAIIQKV